MSQWPYRPTEQPDGKRKHTFVKRVDYKPTYLAHQNRVVVVNLPDKEEE